MRRHLLALVLLLAALTSCQVERRAASPTPPLSPTSPTTPTSPPFTPTPSPTSDLGVRATPTPPRTLFHDIIFSKGVSEDSQPVSPTKVFSHQTEMVYAFFAFDGMRPEMEWSQVWYYETTEIGRETQSWKWGSSGLAYIYRRFPDGMKVGEYELILYANGILQAVGTFTVR